MQQQVAEIDGVHGREALLVEPIEVDRLAVGEIADLGRRNLIGGEPAILPALDDRVQRPRWPAPLVNMSRGQNLLYEAQLVVGVKDREARFEPDRLGMTAQDPRGERVERAKPDALGNVTDHRLQALAHLARRLVGKSDRQHLAGESPARCEDMREARRQHPRLPGAGAGKHQHRPVDRSDRLRLRLIERGEVRRGASFGGGGRSVIDRKLGHQPII